MFTDLEATASSVCENVNCAFGNSALYEPQLAIDGKISTNNSGFYQSAEPEDPNYKPFPWFQIQILRSPQVVTGLVIVNRYNTGGDRLKDVEIRAGLDPVPNGFTGLLTVNKQVASFAGPGVAGETYFINFDSPIYAEYVTIQITDNNGILQLNEVTLVYKGENNSSKYIFRFKMHVGPC